VIPQQRRSSGGRQLASGSSRCGRWARPLSWWVENDDGVSVDGPRPGGLDERPKWWAQRCRSSLSSGLAVLPARRQTSSTQQQRQQLNEEWVGLTLHRFFYKRNGVRGCRTSPHHAYLSPSLQCTC